MVRGMACRMTPLIDAMITRACVRQQRAPARRAALEGAMLGMALSARHLTSAPFTPAPPRPRRARARSDEMSIERDRDIRGSRPGFQLPHWVGGR